VITPRRTRLVRVPDLHAFRLAIGALAPRADAIVVPTHAAARVLARTLERDESGLLTREGLYRALHGRLTNPPRRLTALERDAIAQTAAEQAAANEPDLVFRVRPGLVAEMLRFYDHLRRQSQQVKRFEELISDALGGAADDRGAGRLMVQTRFLAASFREYDARLAQTGACDEHTLRDVLVREPAATPLRRVVVTVGDWIADPGGLFVADFDLLSRIPNLEAIDLVSTEAVLASGMHERLHSWWPGLEEIDAIDLLPGVQRVRPVLVTPPVEQNEAWFTVRDREEELVAVAGRFDAKAAPHTAVVFKQPLPYLYLAPDVLGAAGVPFDVFDALPLAAEPAAAAIDAVLDAVESGFTRTSLVALLRSPHFRFESNGAPLTRADISELDATLSASRYLGDPARLETVGAGCASSPALDAAVAIARELAPLAASAPASEQLQRLHRFCVVHFTPLDESDPFAERETRAREAITTLLDSIAAAHAAFHDPQWTIADVAGAVRRWISEHTFDRSGDGLAGAGVSLLDDQAARYGAFDEMTIVGLIEHEWPERTRRNIFYGTSLLKALGWPSEKDRRAGADARFLDLVASAQSRVFLSTFTLDDEALVARSVQLDEIARARLRAMPIDGPAQPAADPTLPENEWRDVRGGRTPASDPAFHGSGVTAPAKAWSVSALETYIGCPFKFYAQHVLRLQEEPDDEEVMDPRRQGQFVHDVFERFFGEWQASGRRSITPENLADAREMFVVVVDRALEKLPEAEAGLERTRLLGSPAAAGLGEAVFRMEAERPVPVVERLLEEPLIGDFTIRTDRGSRTVPLRGKADRLDLLEDGTFRLIDYKLGWPPNKARALQLPIYALCAEQKLAGRNAQTWALGEAAYLAFKGPRRVVPLFSNIEERDEALAKAQQRLGDTLDAIARGEFPPTPDDVFRCETCNFAAVCRKDYV